MNAGKKLGSLHHKCLQQSILLLLRQKARLFLLDALGYGGWGGYDMGQHPADLSFFVFSRVIL